MKLFEVTIDDGAISYPKNYVVYVVAEHETAAATEAISVWMNDWDRGHFAFVTNVALVASEGQYGKLEPLIIVPREEVKTKK